MGVEPLRSGIASFHVTFSAALHLSGKFRSALTPFKSGPRHCGQFARAGAASDTARHEASNHLRILFLLHGRVGDRF
jgi:hypothetical protein